MKMKKNINSMRSAIIVLTIFIMLTSCSKDWSCPAEKSFSCRTISQVDDNQTTNSVEGKKNQKEIVNKNLLTQTVKGVKTDELIPIRTQEVIGKILLTPYIDKEGNLHSGKYIYIVDEKPEWMMVN